MFSPRQCVQLAFVALEAILWITLTHAAPLASTRQSVPLSHSHSDHANSSSHIRTTQSSSVSTVHSRDTVFNASNIRIGTIKLTPTIRDEVEGFLKLIGPDAASRFVSFDKPTAFGTDDPVDSNNALSALVDRVFTAGQGISNRAGWVDTYTDCLIDVGDALPDFDDQSSILDNYYDALKALAPAQAKLVAAYKAAKNESTTNIAVKMPSGQLVDSLTMRVVDQWAASAFGKDSSASGKRSAGGKNSTDRKTGAAAQSHSDFSAKDYQNYLKLNASYTKVLAEYNEVGPGNKIAAQGYMFRNMIVTPPAAVFNLSMIVAGDPSSKSAQYAAAWSATILNTTTVSASDAQDLGDNLQDGFHNGTFNDTSIGSSINDEAPKTMSSSRLHSTAAANATTISSGISTSTSPLKTAATAARTSGKSSASGSGSMAPAAATTAKAIPPAVVQKKTNRDSIRRSSSSWPRPRSRLQRRSSASKALLLAAAAGAAADPASKSSSGAKGKIPNTGTISSAKDAAQLVPPHVVFAGSAASPELENISTTQTQTAFSTSSTSVFGIPSSLNSSDPLAGVPNIPLKDSTSLFMMSLQEGAWSNDRPEFLAYIASEHPDIYTKYFGNGTNGDGPLGKRWTHIFLISTFKANSTDLLSCQLVGMVYDVIPGLTAVSASNATASATKTKSSSPSKSSKGASSTSASAGAKKPKGTSGVIGTNATSTSTAGFGVSTKDSPSQDTSSGKGDIDSGASSASSDTTSQGGDPKRRRLGLGSVHTRARRVHHWSRN